MASSSTSSSSLWKYDVFLSFRGENTRKTFVDHFYSSLEQRGIHTYKDDTKLLPGESIRPSILKAIDESHIAVIIFSKNYADSSWCLDELEYIMKFRHGRGQIVMPIFYDVDPSDVRKQKGEFGQGFAKQTQENVIKTESWREALVDASNLAGWEPKHIANGHEAQGIKRIVDVICKTSFSPNIYVDEGLVGMGTRLNDMKSRLKVGAGGVRMVGIWGLGGSGKTTLASFVYTDIWQYFDGHCIIVNIREESSNINGLKTLQEKFLSIVLKTQMTVPSVMHGKYEIKKRLCGSKVLIILDDVDEHEQLKALAGSHDWFGDGSRIIITTRNEHLLNKHKVDDISHVRLLLPDEAFRLFYKHAYNENKPVEDYATLSPLVVYYAGGLPLALVILGSFLYDKDKNEWMSTLARLEEIPETKIMEKLKISYDGLTHYEKELFLDIACFFRRKRKDKTMEILDACGFHPGIGVTVLRQKALITTLDGTFDMHDLVQEMAFYIVRGDHPNNPEEHSRIWQSKKINEMCSSNATIQENYKIEAIQYYSEQIEAIQYHGEQYHIEDVPSHFFKHVSSMKKLRFLSVTTYCNGCNEGPTFLSHELRYIQMSCRLERSLPVNCQLKKLVVLKLDSSLQEELWKGKKDLPNLRTIELVRLFNLIETPDFDGLPNLERFMLCGSPHLKEIHPSIGRLKRLVCLIIQGCYRLNRCPPITGSKKLETIVLSGCSKIFNVSEIQQNMGNLRYVDMEKKVGFQSFHGGLRKLDLRWCNLVDENFCSDVLELANLQELDLRGNKFTQLNFSLLQLPRLKWLDVSSCRNLVKLSELPSSIAVLIAENCLSLENLGDISNCKWLWKVSLMGNNKLGLLGGDILLDSMLQGNAIEQHFISFALTDLELWKKFVRGTLGWKKKFALKLPHNWLNEFCGFIIITVSQAFKTLITMNIREEVDEGCQSEHRQESYVAPEHDDHSTIYVAYVSFSSLQHTAWLKSAYNMIWFSLSSENECSIIAELVPRRSKGDPMHRTKLATDCSQFWDEHKDSETFTIQLLESNSSIDILWRPLN